MTESAHYVFIWDNSLPRLVVKTGYNLPIAEVQLYLEGNEASDYLRDGRFGSRNGINHPVETVLSMDAVNPGYRPPKSLDACSDLDLRRIEANLNSICRNGRVELEVLIELRELEQRLTREIPNYRSK